MFGIDTTTEEGRAAFKAEFDAIAELAPELVKKDMMVFPHEMGTKISTEAHFQRLWGYYRSHTLRGAVADAVAAGKVAQGDADLALRFMGGKSQLSAANYGLAKTGLLPALANDEGFLACDRVMGAIGMHGVPFSRTTSEPIEHQFWSNVDGTFGLTDGGMREELPNLIADPSNRMKVEAMMEETKQLGA